MKTPLLSVLLLLALVGCSADAPAPTATTAAARDAATAAPRNDPTARARLGIVFADSDPWMAGAVIEHGRIHVGDRLFLSTDNNTHILVTITAIRDDATQADVTEAAARQGVFLSFRADSPKEKLDVDAGAILAGDQADSARSAMP